MKTRKLKGGKVGNEDQNALNIQIFIEEDHAGAEIVFLIDADGVFVGPVTVSCA